MQGISRMRLPMSAKLPAICAILSENGFGMKCVHASMRIMCEILHPSVLVPCPGTRPASGASRPPVRHRARAMAAPPLSRPRDPVPRGSWARGSRRRALSARRRLSDALALLGRGPQGYQLVADPHELRAERLELLGARPAGA